MLVIRQEGKFLLLSLVLSFQLVQVSLFTGAALAADTETKKNSSQSSGPAAQNKSAAKSESGEAKGLHRLDFHLQGVSCATCILAMRAALRATKGVNRAEIALRKPYGGVLIYDPGKTTIKELISVAEKADRNRKARVLDPVEEPVAAIPLVLVPKYNALQKSETLSQ